MNGHKRLNKRNFLEWRKTEKRQIFTKYSTMGHKRLNDRQMTQQRAEETQQRDT